MLGISECVRDGLRPAIPEATEWQRITNQINASTIFARADFVSVLCASHRDRSYHFVIAVWSAKEAESAA